MNELDLAARLRKCRNAVQGLYPDDWRDRLVWWMDLIRKVAAERNIETLPAAITLAEEAAKKADGVAQMWMWAAACELLEPTP